MTTDTNTGGPAFPHHRVTDAHGWDQIERMQGMTLRDWFAGQALVGLLASNSPMGENVDPHQLVAKAAYATADAMLEARK